MSTIRCCVKRDGEVVHDETFVNDRREVAAVSYPGMQVMGSQIEVAFEFDPPLITPAAAGSPKLPEDLRLEGEQASPCPRCGEAPGRFGTCICDHCPMGHPLPCNCGNAPGQPDGEQTEEERAKAAWYAWHGETSDWLEEDAEDRAAWTAALRRFLPAVSVVAVVRDEDGGEWSAHLSDGREVASSPPSVSVADAVRLAEGRGVGWQCPCCNKFHAGGQTNG